MVPVYQVTNSTKQYLVLANNKRSASYSTFLRLVGNVKHKVTVFIVLSLKTALGYKLKAKRKVEDVCIPLSVLWALD